MTLLGTVISDMNDLSSSAKLIVNDRLSNDTNHISHEIRTEILANFNNSGRILISHSNEKISIKGSQNFLLAKSLPQLEACRKISVEGNNNFIYLSDNARIHTSKISIKGNNNFIFVGRGSRIRGHFSINGNMSYINIGSKVYFTHQGTHFSVQEDRVGISLGDESLIGGTKIRTSDSHSILDMESGRRINPPASVVLGRRVWTAQDVRILKGVSLPNDTIVGAGSIVTRSVTEPNTVIAGSPAKVVRRGVVWDAARIPMPDDLTGNERIDMPRPKAYDDDVENSFALRAKDGGRDLAERRPLRWLYRLVRRNSGR